MHSPLEQFDPISLERIDGVRFMDRIDFLKDTVELTVYYIKNYVIKINQKLVRSQKIYPYSKTISTVST